MKPKTSPKQTPYELFVKAIAAGIKPTVHDCWKDFAFWEMARYYGDDPSHPAKAAIEWIYSMEDLRGGLDEFEGEAKAECLLELDRSTEAFAKLEHSDELIHAIGLWIEYRLDQ